MLNIVWLYFMDFLGCDCDEATDLFFLLLLQIWCGVHMGQRLFFSFQNTPQHLHLVLSNLIHLCRAPIFCAAVVSLGLLSSKVRWPQFVSAFKNLGQMAL